MGDEVIKIPVDPDGRYIILVSGKIDYAELEDFLIALQEWWKSKESVFVFGFRDMQDIKVIKLEDIE